jgi:hypothetical protein
MVTEYETLASVIKQSTQQRGGEKRRNKERGLKLEPEEQNPKLWDIRTN